MLKLNVELAGTLFDALGKFFLRVSLIVVGPLAMLAVDELIDGHVVPRASLGIWLWLSHKLLGEARLGILHRQIEGLSELLYVLYLLLTLVT